MYLLGDVLAKVPARISPSPCPSNEVANIHPWRPRLQERRGRTRDVRHNRWKDRGDRVRVIENKVKPITGMHSEIRESVLFDN